MTSKLFILFFVLVYLASCSEKKSTEPKEVEPEIALVPFTPQEFHNIIASKVNEVHVLITVLQQLDDQDAAPEIIVETATKNISSLDMLLNDISALTPAGELGEQMKELTLQYVASKKAIINIYIDFAPQLSIESEWTDEDYALWTSNAEPYFGVSDQMFKELTDLQAMYLAKNNITESAI